MASYIQQILGPDEQVMAEGRVTRWIYARALAICVVVVALGAVAAFLLARGADAAAPRWPGRSGSWLCCYNRRLC